MYIECLIPESIPAFIYDNCLLLLLVVDEIDPRNTMMFDSWVGETVAVDLPEGTYSFYSFVVDGRYPYIDSAPLYGLGLPIHDDLTGATAVQIEYPGDIFSLMIDAPYKVVRRREPSTLTLIVVDTNEYRELPRTFGEFLVGQGEALTGLWLIQDQDDGGVVSESSIDLVQQGSYLSGMAITVEIAGRDQWVVQQLLEGAVDNTAGAVSLSSHHVRIIEGPRGAPYYPDSWSGWMQDSFTIAGTSIDSAGQRGQFVMTRQG